MHWRSLRVCSIILLHSLARAHYLSRTKRSYNDPFGTGFPFNLHTYPPYKFPFPYPFPPFPRFAPPLPLPAPIPYPSPIIIHHPHKHHDHHIPQEVAPIVLPAGAAAFLSVASLLHALISKKFDPPFIPIPITQTFPVPVPLKVPVPLRVNKYIPIGVPSSSEIHHHSNNHIQTHSSSNYHHELDSNNHWIPMEKPYESEHIGLTKTLSTPTVFNNFASDEDDLEENWKRRTYIKQRRKQKMRKT